MENIKLKVIGLGDEVPEGFRFISSWEVEELLCNNFEVFKDLELSSSVGYYKIINPTSKSVRWLWLHRLGFNSGIGGNFRNLTNDNWVRGVLIVNKEGDLK